MTAQFDEGSGEGFRQGVGSTDCEGFLLTRDWGDTPRGLELEFWLATTGGPRRLLIRGERSVFFLEAEEAERARALLGGEGVECRPLALRSFRMAAVVGVYCTAYRTARVLADQLREAGFDPLEADINPADRYLMERFIRGGVRVEFTPGTPGSLPNPVLKPARSQTPLAVMSFDIETAMEGIQLYSIGIHALRGGQATRRVFMLGEGAGQDFVVAVDSERALLLAFLDFVSDYDPDVLIGWNVVNFDTWYLQRVADKYGLRLNLGRERRPVHWRELDEDGERRTARMPGRVLLDGIDLLRAAFYRFESFSLNNVAGEILGDAKLLQGGDRGEEIGRLFREDKSALAAYNLKDCELVSDIFQATRLLDFAVARSAMTGLNIDRLGGSVASFDNLYLPRLHREGFVAPNASRDLVASPGGYVLDSEPGIYDHVLVLDFKSLYPSIIRTFCIDPLGLALGVEGGLTEAETVPGFLEARFARSRAILPSLIGELWQLRDRAKAAGDGPLSQAIKIIMNSFYGVLGSTGCRFFDARLASSITRRGHDILKRTRDRIEALGHRVIYGDTDSVFVWVRSAASSEEAQAAGRALEADLNRWWRQSIGDEFGVESVLELEFETHYRRFLMPTVRGSDKGSKKRYAGLVSGPDGEQLVFKGLENVRTDWTRLARDFQQELYRRVFAGEPYAEFVKATVAEVRAGQRDAQLVYRKRLRRPLDDYQRNVPPHVQAARLCRERGLAVPSRGSWVEYVITSGGAEPAGDPRSPLDYQYYVDRQLQPVADGILVFLGTSFAELVDQQIDLFAR
ncbi:DNA polymerase II [Parahaliea maris]|uniref:DNA polymerase n=1 Tax=Parahaliea maris TaxID=2716870 RepID=A0A5C8ZKP1_9GAMM|nr:DNA polymerase II [Parahaliea maris]TXS88998.1 DNA polymerase II [Parahaliea maris]